MKQTVQSVIDKLQADYGPDEVVVVSLWSASDLLNANQRFEELRTVNRMHEDHVTALWNGGVSEWVSTYLETVTSELNEQLEVQIIENRKAEL